MSELIWSNYDPNSENSLKMREAKRINGPEFWPTMREVFQHDCAHLPMTRFRLWASIHTVPLVTQYRTAKFLGETFYHASRDPNVAAALKENWIGIPEAHRNFLQVASDFDTSMQRIQDLGHLLIAGFGKEDLSKYNSIVEIGAGYGDMCSVVHAMGFKGKYTIVDIPELQPLHNFYLNKQGIYPEFSFEDDNIGPADLVISTWALSETPLDYRERLMPKIKDSKNWLILSQSKIFGMAVNEEYFQDFFKDKNMKQFPLVSSGLDAWDGSNNYYIVKE